MNGVLCQSVKSNRIRLTGIFLSAEFESTRLDGEVRGACVALSV